MPKTQTGQGVAREGGPYEEAVDFSAQLVSFSDLALTFLLLFFFGSLPLPAAVYHNFVDLLSANSKNNNNNAKKSNNRAEENQKRGAPERRQLAMAPKKLLPAAQKTLPNKI